MSKPPARESLFLDVAVHVLRDGYNEPMSGSDHVKPASPGLKLTYDDFVLFPDDGKLHELIDGEHYVTPSPNVRHQQIQGDLFALMWTYLEAHPIGRVFTSRLDVVFSRFDVVEPDIIYLSHERAENVVTKANLQGAPELVIEIGSPSTRQRDETIKRHLYERSGVSEYWVIDPDIDVVRVYRRTGDSFARPIELSREAGDVLTTSLLPGLELPLARIFRE
jgi:Uma2 family endonuclease